MKRAVLYSFQVRGVKRRGRIIRQRGMGFDAVKLKGHISFLLKSLRPGQGLAAVVLGLVMFLRSDMFQ